MASQVMTADVPADNSPIQLPRKAYHAYRHAKAAWDVHLYAPERFDEDLPDELNELLCNAHTDALNAFMVTPAATLGQLSRKLAVFRDEDLKDWYRAGEFVSILAADAERLLRAKEDC